MRTALLFLALLPACGTGWGELETSKASGSYSDLSDCSCDILRDSAYRLDTLSMNCFNGPGGLTLTFQLHAPTLNTPTPLDAKNLIINAVNERGIVWGAGTGTMELKGPAVHKDTFKGGAYYEFFAVTTHVQMVKQKFCSPIEENCTEVFEPGAIDMAGSCKADVVIP